MALSLAPFLDRRNYSVVPGQNLNFMGKEMDPYDPGDSFMDSLAKAGVVGGGLALGGYALGGGLSAGAGTVAPWGAGEAVSGTWGAGAGAGAAGAAGGAMDGLEWGSLDAGPGAYSTSSGFGSALGPEGMGLGSGAVGADVISQPGFLDYIRKIPGIGNILSKMPGSGPNGQMTDQDLMRMLGSLGGAGLGYLGSSEQRRMFQNLADRYWGAGEPYRQRLEQTYKDPTGWMQSPEVQAPVQQGSDIMARSLSMQGNPAGSGNALQQLQNYSSNQLFGRLGEERTRLGNLGGIPGMAGASTSAATNAIGAAGNQYNAVGAGVNDIFNPPRTLAQSLNEYKRLQGAMT